MSIEINKVILQGRLAKDPELGTTAGGTTKATFSLATNLRRRNGETGQYEPHPVFNRVVCYGKTADTVSRYCMKGKEVYVEGELETRSWEDQPGSWRFTTEVVAAVLKLGADPKGVNRSGGQAYNQSPQPGNAPMDDWYGESAPYPDA